MLDPLTAGNELFLLGHLNNNISGGGINCCNPTWGIGGTFWYIATNGLFL